MCQEPPAKVGERRHVSGPDDQPEIGAAGAIVLTSNKAFSAWGEVFAGDAVMASAALDRLLHRCMVANIRGESYRLKEKGLQRRRRALFEELAAIAASS
jgi:hypothetical protein